MYIFISGIYRGMWQKRRSQPYIGRCGHLWRPVMTSSRPELHFHLLPPPLSLSDLLARRGPHFLLVVIYIGAHFSSSENRISKRSISRRFPPYTTTIVCLFYNGSYTNKKSTNSIGRAMASFRGKYD